MGRGGGVGPEVRRNREMRKEEEGEEIKRSGRGDVSCVSVKIEVKRIVIYFFIF